MTPFGAYLRELRKSRGLRLREVEELAGLSNAYVSQLECGSRKAPSIDCLARLAKAYRLPTIDLLRAGGWCDDDVEVTTPSAQERLDWAFDCIMRDPAYRTASFLRPLDLPAPVKRFVVEVYQVATGRVL